MLIVLGAKKLLRSMLINKLQVERQCDNVLKLLSWNTASIRAMSDLKALSTDGRRRNLSVENTMSLPSTLLLMQ